MYKLIETMNNAMTQAMQMINYYIEEYWADKLSKGYSKRIRPPNKFIYTELKNKTYYTSK